MGDVLDFSKNLRASLYFESEPNGRYNLQQAEEPDWLIQQNRLQLAGGTVR
jgi:hypothetical protein